MRRVRATIVAVEKAVSVTYCECVFLALGIQHAMRMHHIAICGLLGSTIFFNLISTTQRFSKKIIENEICVLILSTNLFEKFFFLTRTERDMIKNVHCLHVKYPISMSDFNET